jgi:hypothetical protein
LHQKEERKQQQCQHQACSTPKQTQTFSLQIQIWGLGDLLTTAKQDCKISTKDLEEETNCAKETIGRAFIQVQMKCSRLSKIPEILEQVMYNLFVTKPEPKEQLAATMMRT